MSAQNPGDANEMQKRVYLDQAVSLGLERFRLENPELFVKNQPPPKAEIPTPLKWAGGITAGVFGACTVAFVLWIVTSISAAQITLAKIEERLASLDTQQRQRLDQIETRLAALERNKKE